MSHCVACGRLKERGHQCSKRFEQRQARLDREAEEDEPPPLERTFDDKMREAESLLNVECE